MMQAFVYLIIILYEYNITIERGFLSRRITILLDDDLDGKLRKKQAQLIHKTKNSVSFTHILNETLRSGLKNGKSKHWLYSKKRNSEGNSLMKEGLKAGLCDCVNGECNASPENRLLHVGNICYHDDGTYHKIEPKN